MKTLALTAGLAIGAAAYASFDLMMLPSTDGRIHRYDPANDVRLGSFGNGTAITDIALNPTNNQILVQRGSFMALYDSSTGERTQFASTSVGVTHSQWNAAANRFDALAVSTTSFLDLHSVNPLSYTTGPSLGVAARNHLRVGTAAIGMSLATNEILFHRWANATGTPTSAGSASFAGANRISPLTAGVAPNTAYAVGQSATNSVFYSFSNLSGTGNLAFNGAFLSGFNNAQPIYALRSHTGAYVVGQDSTTANWRITDIGITASNLLSIQGSTVLSGLAYQPARPAIILAPEPSSVIALGIGAIALLRKRR